MKTEFKVYHNQGYFRIDGEAGDYIDALRKALWFCWREDLKFERMESITGNVVIRIAVFCGNDIFTTP